MSYFYGELLADVRNRFLFNGKENASPAPDKLMLDYGARQYDPALARWTTPDPLADMYTSHSPYCYCFNNPVAFTDPNGMRPIYDLKGNLLGTDDNGLHGDPIFMDSINFSQGMSPEKAAKHDVGVDSLSFESFRTYFVTQGGLKDRPDWDGYLTFQEATDWYRNGDGKPLYVSLDKIDLSNFKPSEYKKVGAEFYVNTIFDSTVLDDRLVYGSFKLRTYPNDMVRAFADTYNFEMHAWNSFRNFIRNIETIIGGAYAWRGVPYQINFYGYKHLKTSIR